VYQTLDPVFCAVPTQSFLARSKYDAAPGASGATTAAVVDAVAVVAAVDAVAAGAATARPPRTAVHAAKVMKRRPGAIAKPPSSRLRAEDTSADWQSGLGPEGSELAARALVELSPTQRARQVTIRKYWAWLHVVWSCM
jgi:hypothetical protein